VLTHCPDVLESSALSYIEEVRALAVLEERQRLARELHDSVAQALYGIGLGAQAALTWLERDPSRLAEPLRYISELADTGMAEVRALIFELRPESLEREGLVVAIERQAGALRARYRATIDVVSGPEPDTSPRVKEALFRIAQEAMHNALKHANPDSILVTLTQRRHTLHLEVTDDGNGFDPSASFPGHLGLTSMSERARLLGGDVEITSAPGIGTCVHVWMPLAA
jgi:signal transduction histidine kinase